MTPLDWLGGPEQPESQLVLQQLAGQWRDMFNGSYYHLLFDGVCIDVLTIKPNGKQRFTKGLIRTRAHCVVWGRPKQDFRMTMETDTITWTRGGRVFVWQKLQ